MHLLNNNSVSIKSFFLKTYDSFAYGVDMLVEKTLVHIKLVQIQFKK